MENDYVKKGKIRLLWTTGEKMMKSKENIDEAFELMADKLNERKITWWLDAGSLLGAIREGKRIEWDDDYDIGFWKKDCPRVFMALRELEKYDLVCTGNLHLVVENKNGEHYVCVSPHEVVRGHVYKLTGILGKLEHGLGFPIRTILAAISNILKKHKKESINKNNVISNNKCLSLKIQLLIQWFQMRINYRIRYRGKLEDYSEFVIKDMDGVPSPVPIGYKNILTYRYGDYMVPRKKDDYICLDGKPFDIKKFDIRPFDNELIGKTEKKKRK